MLWDSGPDAIAVIMAGGRLRAANALCRSLLGAAGCPIGPQRIWDWRPVLRQLADPRSMVARLRACAFAPLAERVALADRRVFLFDGVPIPAAQQGGIAWYLRDATVLLDSSRTPPPVEPKGLALVAQLRMDAAGQIDFPYLNPCVLDILGLRPEDEQRSPGRLMSLVLPEDVPILWASIRESYVSLVPWHHEFRIRRQGQLRWIRADGLPVRGDPGVVVWDSVLSDISESKAAETGLSVAKVRAEAAEAEARHDRQRLEDAIDSFSEGFALLDATGRLVMFNGKLAEMYRANGFEPDAEMTSDVLTEGLIRAGALRETAGRVVPMTDWEHQTADGRWIRGTDRRTRDGSTVAIRTDITDAKLREEQLRKALLEAMTASKAKSDFLANMSHELRTPLNAIIGFSEIMHEELFGPIGTARYRGYVDDIHGSGTHLLAIINTVLDLARIEAGKLALDEETVDLEEVVDSCLRLLRTRAVQGEIDLTASVAESMPKLRGDSTRLRQILLNLLSNAVKFTPARGSVTVRCALAGGIGGVVIEVVDTGVGIAPGELLHAFEPFGVGRSALHKRRHDGTGLGLPLCKALVDLHGGTVELQSQEGVGTIATVWLPPDRVVPGGNL